ncbi:MAG: glucose-6-phosphate dehydrogenase [Caldilineales bacterium]|nr:glucose-6-phosphate dehydrogenase [Caldilineales bacterium]
MPIFDRLGAPAPTTIIIFGASGDLAFRKLVPAFYSLASAGLLPEKYFIIGAARSEMDDESFREHLRQGVDRFGRVRGGDDDDWGEFARHILYHRLVYDDVGGYHELARKCEKIERENDLGSNRLFYLATPPTLYESIVEELGNAGLCQSGEGYTRIVVEKPFGRDLESAHNLNCALHKVFNEDQIYRIDHYLGKETVQNIMVFRFANAIFEPIWNRHYIDHVQISVLESVGVGRRAGYYDQAGVMRDMFQNHLLQLLSLSAMEPPTAWDATLLRDEKVKVLRAVRSPTGEALHTNTVRAQYRSLDGHGPSYLKEDGVAADSQTATYAALELYIDNWRWQGVPFYLRSGKSMAKKLTEVVIRFKEVPHMLFNLRHDASVTPNQLSFCLQPEEGFDLGFQTKIPGAGMRTRSVDMSYQFESTYGHKALPEAYERLLLDAMLGDASLFARADEIEQSWRIIDNIVGGWQSGDGPVMSYYEPGSWGPAAAEAMLAATGRDWTANCLSDDDVEKVTKEDGAEATN